MDLSSLTAAIKGAALETGFASAGICPAASPAGWSHFQEWLEREYDGEMAYLRNRADAYEHPRHVLEGVRSVILLTVPYRTTSPASPTAGSGRVSRYAWNDTDYHDLIHDRLKQLAARIRAWQPEARTRGVVDTAPLLERDLAQQAGLGWIAKNTMLIDRSLGSYFFLAALLTDLELEYDERHTSDHCGTCRACLDACPTQAFPEPYVLDARRCISYLTIELRGAMPRELRPSVGDWVFGCDVCQEVCPWNRKGAHGDPELFAPAESMNPLELLPLLELSEEDFRRRFRHTPLWRPKRRGLLRNAAIVLGNQRDPRAIEPLARRLADPDPIVRGACAWALGQIGGTASLAQLRDRIEVETDPEVREELQLAVQAASGSVP